MGAPCKTGCQAWQFQKTCVTLCKRGRTESRKGQVPGACSFFTWALLTHAADLLKASSRFSNMISTTQFYLRPPLYTILPWLYHWKVTATNGLRLCDIDNCFIDMAGLVVLLLGWQCFLFWFIAYYAGWVYACVGCILIAVVLYSTFSVFDHVEGTPCSDTVAR